MWSGNKDNPGDISEYSSLPIGEYEEHVEDVNNEQGNFETKDDTGADDDNDDVLRPGDHIYVREGFSQRHGLVIEAPSRLEYSENTEDHEYCDGDEKSSTIVLTFYEVAMAQYQAQGNIITNYLWRKNPEPKEEDSLAEECLTGSGEMISGEVKKQTLRQFMRKSRKVEKVRYGVTRARRILSRAGSAACVKADQRGLIMLRIEYLIANPTSLPEFAKLSANDECVAVWCRTGRWVTLQAASMLEIMGASHLGTALVAGGVVSQMTVTQTMPWIPGYVLVWSVPATVAYPILVPILVGYGLTSLVPLEVLRRNRQAWNDISDSLGRSFWASASDQDRMDYFGDSINANKDDVKNFFGFYDKPDDEDENVGKYMPLTIDGNKFKDDDDSDGEDLQTLNDQDQDRKLAVADPEGGVSSSGRNQGRFGFGTLLRSMSERIIDYQKGPKVKLPFESSVEEQVDDTTTDMNKVFKSDAESENNVIFSSE